MCDDCAREYRDPRDRRFHAEPVACPACGPVLTFLRSPEDRVPRFAEDALGAAEDVLRDRGILALKGLGGFHLACDARDEAAVRRLRERKHRFGKPLAIMLPDLETARALCEVSEEDARILESRQRPSRQLPRAA